MGMRGRSRGGGNREERVVGAWKGQGEEQGMSGGEGWDERGEGWDERGEGRGDSMWKGQGELREEEVYVEQE